MSESSSVEPGHTHDTESEGYRASRREAQTEEDRDRAQQCLEISCHNEVTSPSDDLRQDAAQPTHSGTNHLNEAITSEGISGSDLEELEPPSHKEQHLNHSSIELFVELWEIVFTYLDPVDIVVFSELCKASWQMAHSIRYRGTTLATLQSTISRAKSVFAAWPTFKFDFTPVTSSELDDEIQLNRFWRQLLRLTTEFSPRTLERVNLAESVVPTDVEMAKLTTLLPGLPKLPSLAVFQRRLYDTPSPDPYQGWARTIEPPPPPVVWFESLSSLCLKSKFLMTHASLRLDLPLLRALTLEYVKVQLGHLPSLQSLTLEGDVVWGTDLTFLDCPQLKTLRLRSISDFALHSLSGIPPVTELELSTVAISEIPEALSSSLRHFTCSDVDRLNQLDGARNAMTVSIERARALESVIQLENVQDLRLRLTQRIGGVNRLTRLKHLTVEDTSRRELRHSKKRERMPGSTDSCVLQSISLSGPWPISNTDLSLIAGSPFLHTLRLHCPVQDLDAFHLLSKLQSIDLSGTSIMDPSPLAGATTLVLKGCVGITDISSLGLVQNLNLSGCSKVNDASALARVHRLDLSRTGIQDVSMLGQCHWLSLEGTPVIDVSHLGGVYHLDLRGTRVNDISALRNVSELLLARCFSISDFSVLQTQEVLDLGMLQGVTDAVLRQLTRVRILHINQCLSVTSVSTLKHLRELNMEGCINMIVKSEILGIPRLFARGYKQIK
eukprot:m.162971 g.162971  ORF g.162971 m.162971 type:complete len:725 (-) comp14615_c0_seq8:38-2212(-)